MVRVPMIRFRYGVRDAIEKTMAVVAGAPEVAAPARYLRPDELPKHLQRAPMSAQEMAMINVCKAKNMFCVFMYLN